LLFKEYSAVGAEVSNGVMMPPPRISDNEVLAAFVEDPNCVPFHAPLLFRVNSSPPWNSKLCVIPPMVWLPAPVLNPEGELIVLRADVFAEGRLAIRGSPQTHNLCSRGCFRSAVPLAQAIGVRMSNATKYCWLGPEEPPPVAFTPTRPSVNTEPSFAATLTPGRAGSVPMVTTTVLLVVKAGTGILNVFTSTLLISSEAITVLPPSSETDAVTDAVEVGAVLS
jgi:hypothetical protein